MLTAALALALLFASTYAGYDISISNSDTDPDVNTSESHLGLDSLWVWVKCAEEGLSAFEAKIAGDMPHGAFVARSILAITQDSTIIFGVGCLTGDSVDVVLGAFPVFDMDSSGSRLFFDGVSEGQTPIATSCDSTVWVTQHIPRVVGFASDGGDPDTTGSEYGCGVFPDQPAYPRSGPTFFSWSDEYDEPGTGLGADAPVHVMEPSLTDADVLVVGGEFGSVGSLSVPNIAKLTLDRSSGSYIETSWSIPTNWASLSALASGKAYRAVATDASGGMAAGSTDDSQAFVYCPSSGDCVVGEPYIADPSTMAIHALTFWSETGRCLVGGDFQDYSETPESNEYYGLAQYNVSEDEWEWFGQPAVGEYKQYWVQADGTGDGTVYAMQEVSLPGKTFDRTVFIGGSFGYIFGTDHQTSGDLTFDAEWQAYLTPDGTFSSVSGYPPGPVFAFAQAPQSARDGGAHLYAAGSFGYHTDAGYEWPSVLALDMTGSSLTSFAFLPPGPTAPPYAGPMLSGQFNAPYVDDLSATTEYLYATGNFDQLRQRGGPAGITFEAHGYARYWFAQGFWLPQETGGDPALNDRGRTCVASTWPAVMVGGDFTVVGGSVPSYYVAQADYDVATAAGEPLAPERSPDNVHLAAPSPTPSRGGVRLVYSIPTTAFVRLDVLDVAGRRLKAVVRQEQSAGQYVVEWDGRTDTGTIAATGVYFVRLKAAGEHTTRKITLLR